MAASQEIAAKYQELKNGGTDLGNLIGGVENAGSGGSVQRYQLGNIYWHENTGAHEVHGGILKAFLDYGGVGKNPTYGTRLLGYPTSDEMNTKDKSGRVSYFELGAIYWNPKKGIKGNAVWGECFKKYKHDGEGSYPVTSTLKTNIGEITYFEISCLWKPNNTSFLTVIQMTFNYPRIGLPLILPPDPSTIDEFTKYPFIICGLRASEKASLEQLYPNFMQTIWNNRIVLQPVNKSLHSEPLTVASLRTISEISSSTIISDDSITGVTSTPTLSPNPIVFYASTLALEINHKLGGSTLYDLAVKADHDSWVVAAHHCIYSKKSWDNFAAIHATDLHVSRRLDSYRKILKNKNQEEGVANYNNFNDRLRDLIVYANKLYRLGALDLLILTGDLIDYIYENNDNKNGNGNFEFFQKIILGESPYPDKDIYEPNATKMHEELLVPIFTTLGNHDYRSNAYDLIARVDMGDIGGVDLLPGGLIDQMLNQYGSMNLTRKEATKILGEDHVYYDMNKAYSKVEPLSRVYQYGMINQTENYVVKLGKNKLVMLNTEMDTGVLGVTVDVALKYIFSFLSESEKNFVEANPDSVGMTDEKLSLLKRVLQETNDGVVIVGMHAPPINPKNNEYPHYLRETEHPEVDKALIDDYLMRADFLNYILQQDNQHLEVPFPNWLRSDTLSFKIKDPGELLDYGVSKGKQEEFLKICVGQSGTRKVNLVLCGHVHKRVEYRLDWNNTNNFLKYYTDFYTENPVEYYKTIYNAKSQASHGIAPVIEKRNIRIIPTQDSTVNGLVRTIIDNRIDFTPWQKIFSLTVPTYKNTLNSSNKPADWWEKHSPLIVQTAALGPLDANNRADEAENPDRPNPAFSGFRYIKITNNIITKMHYVTWDELIKNEFKMPWEPMSGEDFPGQLGGVLGNSH